MKKSKLFAATLVVGLCASAAVPVVPKVTTSQDASRRVTVSYTLSDAPAIVTLSAQTNRGDDVWVDVDDINLTYVSGDVNKVVPAGDRSLTWLPHKSWPNQLITGGNIRIGVKAWATDAPPDYMVVSLAASNSVAYYSSARAIPGGVQDMKYKTEYLVMRKCPAGNVTWRMGSPTTEAGREESKEIPHEVTLADDFYIGIYPVTQRQYELVTGALPGNCAKANTAHPVTWVSYRDLRGDESAGFDWPNDKHVVLSGSFVDKLNKLSGLNDFDLPTEAQWEFACRAGSGAALYDGHELDAVNGKSPWLDLLGRYDKNGNALAQVGQYAPNAFGIYDTLGNVWEWCLDWYQESYVGLDPEKGPATGSQRVHRAAGYNSNATQCRCAYRGVRAPGYQGGSVGFRIACAIGGSR